MLFAINDGVVISPQEKTWKNKLYGQFRGAFPADPVKTTKKWEMSGSYADSTAVSIWYQYFIYLLEGNNRFGPAVYCVLEPMFNNTAQRVASILTLGKWCLT